MMFTEEDFKVPLEKQLKLRMIVDEVDNCRDVEQLQENLKQCAEQLMKFQHLLTLTLQKQLEHDIREMFGKTS